MAINGVLQTAKVNLYVIGSKRIEHEQQIIRAITSLFILFYQKRTYFGQSMTLQSLKYISRGSQIPLTSDMHY